VKKIFKKR